MKPLVTLALALAIGVPVGFGLVKVLRRGRSAS
jgi:hypothetical protein